MLDAQARIVAVLERARRRRTRTTASSLVSHADSIQAALSYYLGLPLDALPRFEIEPGLGQHARHVGDWGCARSLGMNEAVAA